MKSNQYLLAARNLLIGAGAYYIAGWLSLPLVFGFGKVTLGRTYSGDFNGYVVAPLMIHLPRAIAAVAAGAATVGLVQSERPVSWAFFPALLYGLIGFLGYHWAHPPLFLDRVAQTIGALFPALACIVGALVAGKHRANGREAHTGPG